MLTRPHLLAVTVAQELNLPDGGGLSIVVWLIGAGIILGLWFVISRTRKRNYDAYWERRRREAERRANDPDMARPDDEESSGGT